MRRLGILLFGASAYGYLTKTTLMSGLANPRGLAFAADGSLYVAEGGTGGTTNCQLTGPGATTACLGATGAISRLRRGKQERVVQNLPSTISAGNVIGVSDLSFQGGNLFATIGFGKAFATRALFGDAGKFLAHLIQITGKTWKKVADLGAFEGAVNPEGGVTDTNPNGLLVEGSTRWVTDSGGNSLLKITADGKVSNATIFQSRNTGRTTDAVPTNIVKGPDGAYYISELTGANFIDGAARVWRWLPGQSPTIFKSGFKTIFDLAFGPDKSLYILEHASGSTGLSPSGKLIKIPEGGSPIVLVAADGNLTRPTGILVDQHGAVFVSNQGVSSTAGEVLKFTF
jgi:hypothetical protein